MVLNPAVIYFCAALTVLITNTCFLHNPLLHDSLGAVITYIISLPYTILLSKVVYHYGAQGITIKSNLLRFLIHLTLVYTSMVFTHYYAVIITGVPYGQYSFRCFTNFQYHHWSAIIDGFFLYYAVGIILFLGLEQLQHYVRLNIYKKDA